MLILTRKQNERVILRAGWLTIDLMVVGTRGDEVLLGFNAPREVEIVRPDAKVLSPKRRPVQ